MKATRRWWRRLLGTWSRRDHEMSDEIASHIEMQTADNVRAGMDPDEARRAAVLKFGAVEAVKESYRDQRGLPFLENTRMDLRYAVRSLWKSPAFTVVAVATLAVGIGANTAIFSLVDQLLLHPEGVKNPERIVVVRTKYDKINLKDIASSAATLTDLRASDQIFEHSSLMTRGDINYTGEGYPQRLIGAVVSASYFDVFGARPALGRVFRQEEDQPDQNRVVVLSYAAWTRLFGADPQVIGRKIDLNQTPHEIIGVMGLGFRWPSDADLWVPAGLPAAIYGPSNRFNESFFMPARLKPGVSFAQANAWLGVLTDRVHKGGDQNAAIAKNGAWGIFAVPFTDSIAPEAKAPLLFLLGAVGVVLLIVCSNVAGLTLARSSARMQELAVRASLGAGRGRLLRQLLSESVLLAGAGAALGLMVAYGGVRLLLLLAPQSVRTGLSGQLNVYVLLFCAGAAVVSALLSGLVPAWQLSRVDPQEALRGSGRSFTDRQKLRPILVAGETALALMLLVGAGLFVRSLSHLYQVNPGFNPKGVMTATLTLPPVQYPSGQQEAKANFYRAVLDNLSANPNIAAAALGVPTPFSGFGEAGSFQIVGRQEPPGSPGPHGDRAFVTAGYFEALGIPIRRGRVFTDNDRITTELVTVIDENLARQYWPNEDPIDQQIQMGERKLRVIGIVGHVTNSNLAADSGKGVYYFTLFQRASPLTFVVAKTRGDTANLAAAIRDAVRAADPNQAVHTMRTMEDSVAASLAPRLFGVRVLGFFAITALLLAALGLYGVIGYSVSQRTREIGIRMALGAHAGSVRRMVLIQGMRLALIGVAIGVVASVAGGRLLETQLFAVSPSDPLTILGMAVILVAAGAVASYLPARRATRVNPAITLRGE